MTNTYSRASERNTYEEAYMRVVQLEHIYGFEPHDELFATPVSGDMIATIRRGKGKQLDRRLGFNHHLNLVVS